MGDLILITGGVRAGKSRYAEHLAHTLGGDWVTYVATAEARDDEMHARIAAHRADRPGSWATIETPLDAAGAITEGSLAPDPPRVFLVDCLTMLVSNLLLDGAEATARTRVDRQIAALRAACRVTAATILVVTNEVGWGVVPPSPLGRIYRDLLGTANQALAADSARVVVLIAGIAVDWKALAAMQGDLTASFPTPGTQP